MRAAYGGGVVGRRLVLRSRWMVAVEVVKVGQAWEVVLIVVRRAVLLILLKSCLGGFATAAVENRARLQSKTSRSAFLFERSLVWSPSVIAPRALLDIVVHALVPPLIAARGPALSSALAFPQRHFHSRMTNAPLAPFDTVTASALSGCQNSAL